MKVHWLWLVHFYGYLCETATAPNHLDQELKKAFNIANEANLSEEELELQHKKKDWIYIQKSSIELATKQGLQLGMEQGLQKGLEQGEWQAKIKIVLNARAMGLPIKTIIALTGLTEDEIGSILKKN